MSRSASRNASSPAAGSPFDLPQTCRRIPAPRPEEPPTRLLTMVAVAFLLASPLITLLVAFP